MVTISFSKEFNFKGVMRLVRVVTILILLISIFKSSSLFAQMPNAFFSIQANACINEKLNITNSSTNSIQFEWDFCEGDLFEQPFASAAGYLPTSFNPKDMDIKKFGNNWYAFVTSRSTNSLYKVSYGSNLNNPSPVITDLGNFENLLSGPEPIKIIEESGNWFGLIVNAGSSSIIRLSFGLDLDNNSPVAETAFEGLDVGSNGMDLATSSNGIVAVIANTLTNKLTMINFGNSIQNNPLVSDAITTTAIDGAASIDDITLLSLNGDWFGFLVAAGSYTIHRLDFGSNLFSMPNVVNISGPNFIGGERPYGIQIKQDKNSFVGVIPTFAGPLYRLDFGASITNVDPTVVKLGDLGKLSNSVNLELVKEGSSWYGFIIDVSNLTINRIDFSNPCSASTLSSTFFQPSDVSYDLSGNYHISLTAFNPNGYSDYYSTSINVSIDVAPDINFLTENVCAAQNVNFTSVNSSNNIAVYSWSFGDTQTSTDPNPTHQYSSSGDYNGSLQVTAENGCNNYIEKTISIYDEPIPNFQIPVTNPLCTNQVYVFDNLSTTDPGYPVTWQWKVNDVNESNNEDLSYTFTQPDNQSVTLTASIPGCENSITKPINTLTEGPLVDFTFPTIRCEDTALDFVNTTSGNVTSYSWNFDDGNTSTDVNTQNTFAAPAVYDVTLSASNAAGCNNYVTKPIQIYSNPVVNFSLSNPCNNQDTKLTDATPAPTDSNLASWLWNFGDGSNTSLVKNPDHIFADAGDYSVSLTATTSESCSSTFQKTVTINSTPVPDINFSSPCEDVTVNFTGTSTGTVTGWDWQIGNLFYNSQNPSRIFTNSGSYDAILAVTADNDCIGTITKTIVVPSKLTPDFTVLKNCTNQETLFSSSTNDIEDPIASYHWVATGIGTDDGSPATFTFPSSGNKNVKLTVNTETGCEYSTTKTVSIISAPQANFTASPETGGVPLAVQFTNTSSGATTFVWKFTENAISTNPAPDPFTYTELGDYSATLTAYNALGCSHSFSRPIRVVNPIVEVELNDLELQQLQNGTVKPMLTIYNNGNIALSNLALFFDISGSVVREYIGVSIPPQSSLDYVVKFELPPGASIKYFCVEADIEDQQGFDNKVCLNIENSFNVFTPYPNPATDQIHVEWISNESGRVTVTLINSMGREVKSFELDASEGYNPLILDTNGLSKGTYLVRISFKGISKTYKILVSQ